LHSARSTTIWLLLSLGAAFAVLAWSAEHGQSPPQLAARAGVAPAVRVVDRPPPANVEALLELQLGIARPRPTISSVQTSCMPSPCSAADVAEANTREAEHEDAIRPASGTSPRAVAELPGAGELIAWHNKAAQLCLAGARISGNTTDVFGPCVADRTNPCTAMCLASDMSAASGAPTTYLLAGTVPRDATALLVGTSRTRTLYPLRGPLLRGTDRRVFILDLGRDDYRVLELLRGTNVIDSLELPAIQAAFEDCQAAHPAMTDFKSCIEGSGAVMPGASFP
jgi:hypothetical protein